MTEKQKRSTRIKQRVKSLLETRETDHLVIFILKRVLRKTLTAIKLIKNRKLIVKIKGKLNKKSNAQSKNLSDKQQYIQFLKRHSDTGFYEEVKEKFEKIPISNGSRYYPKIEANIGIIADEFLYHSFKGIANLVYITSENYLDNMKTIDLLIVASAWKGLNNEWKGMADSSNGVVREKLFQVIETYQSYGIKCIFYSKEDPVNYDRFIEIAQKCDYVFTTAEEVVDQYKEDCHHSNVNVLKFGVNPIFHNPIGFKRDRREKEVLFAGSWYRKYEQRQIDTKLIFDGVLKAGYNLKIIDRNYHSNMEYYFFPKEYVKYISPSVNHEDLQRIHKLYDWSINLNSVKFSPTMFANRIVELQALGNLIISNYSMSINKKFPNVFIIHDMAEVDYILNGYSSDDIYKQQVQGIRKMMSNETTVQRLENLLQTTNFPIIPQNRSVAVIVKEKTNKVQEMFNHQTYQNKQLVTLAEFTDEVKSQFDMLTFFHEEKEYYEYYLEDMINAFKYTNCAYITKDSYYNGEKLISGIEHDFVSVMKDKYRTVFWASLFSGNELIEMNGEVSIENGYSIDHFEFNNKLDVVKVVTKSFKFTVIIPVFNNGEYLLNKSFNSLKRSSMFDEMEILIVDHGSTDSTTLTILNRLKRENTNVTIFNLNDGNESNAKAIEKGIELSTSDYVTFIEPTNETVNDGFTTLYKNMVDKNVDLVIGNIQEDSCYELINDLQHNGEDQVRQLFADTALENVSIQTLMISKSIIQKYKPQFVNNLDRHNSLSFYQLFSFTNKIKLIKEVVYVDYLKIEESVEKSLKT